MGPVRRRSDCAIKGAALKPRRITRGAYGLVLVTAGPHKGKIGLYDDDEGRQAIVYFEAPWLDPYVLIPVRSLAVCPEKRRPLAQARVWRAYTAAARRLRQSGRA